MYESHVIVCYDESMKCDVMFLKLYVYYIICMT